MSPIWATVKPNPFEAPLKTTAGAPAAKVEPPKKR